MPDTPVRADTPAPTTKRYVIFNRTQLFEFLGRVALPPWQDEKGNWIGGGIDCAVLASEFVEWVDGHEHGIPLGQVTTRDLLIEVTRRMQDTQNSTKGRELGRMCQEALQNLAQSVLDWRTD